jgi:hypothetical protein
VLRRAERPLQRLLRLGLPVASEAHSARRWLWPVAIASSLVYGVYILHASFDVDGRRGFSLFDDAMISMRYARNLVQGNGLCWNRGDAPVEGYSNFLWTLWMAVVQLLPLPQRSISLAVSLTSLALLVSNLWLVRALVSKLGGRAPSAFFAVVFSALLYPLIFWSLRGVEVGFLAFLVDAAVVLSWEIEETPRRRSRWLLALVLSALVLVRDDGVVPALIVLGFLTRHPRARGAAKLAAACVVLALLAHLSFRLAYYGAPLPNTYFLKLTGIPLRARAIRGVVSALRTSLAELSIPLMLATFTLVASRSRDRRVWLLVAIVLGQLGTTAAVGGDAWESWGHPDRFVSVGLPALTVLAALGAELSWVDGPRRGYALAFALALVWRSYAIAARDFAPSFFTITPPVDLHRGLRGLQFLSGQLMAGQILLTAVVVALLSGRRMPPALTPWLAMVVIAATTGTNWADFLRDDVTAKQLHWDGRAAAFGVRLGEVLPPTTTIAVVAAGAIPFFSNLPAVDLLGKSDPHIAREAPVERFVPGHDKRDYAYSLSTYKPDLVLELWHHSPEELEAISALGYRQLPNGMYVRSDCSDDLLDRIEHELPEYPFLSTAGHRGLSTRTSTSNSWPSLTVPRSE